MLSSRLLPANTPRQRLSMARDATLGVRLGLRGHGISHPEFLRLCWLAPGGSDTEAWAGKQLRCRRRMRKKAFTPTPKSW